MGCGVIGNTEDSDSFVLGSSPGTPALAPEFLRKPGVFPSVPEPLTAAGRMSPPCTPRRPRPAGDLAFDSTPRSEGSGRIDRGSVPVKRREYVPEKAGMTASAATSDRSRGDRGNRARSCRAFAGDSSERSAMGKRRDRRWRTAAGHSRASAVVRKPSSRAVRVVNNSRSIPPARRRRPEPGDTARSTHGR